MNEVTIFLIFSNSRDINDFLQSHFKFFRRFCNKKSRWHCFFKLKEKAMFFNHFENLCPPDVTFGDGVESLYEF